MSLLRDALRKAELAQEEARQQAGLQPLSLEPTPEPEPAPASEPPPFEPPTFEPLAIADGERPADRTLGDAPEQPTPAKAHRSSERFREPNPARPFHIAVAALAAAGVGVGGYFWLQLHAPSPISYSAPSRPPSPAQAVAAKSAVAEPALASIEEALASLPRPRAAALVVEDGLEANRVAAEKPAAPLSERKARAKSAREARPDPFPLPRPISDPHEQAQASATATAEVETAVIHFTRGNQHARNGRWREAQQAFAKAVASDPENPDFAFNLAVSLDRLGRAREARSSYEHALSLTQSHPAHFPVAAARERMLHLAR